MQTKLILHCQKNVDLHVAMMLGLRSSKMASRFPAEEDGDIESWPVWIDANVMYQALSSHVHVMMECDDFMLQSGD